jgi:DNA-binding transcriptional regulator YhcF (GntR family)
MKISLKRPLNINEKSKMPKYKQIVRSIVDDIERGFLKKGDQLLSITELSIEYLLSRDTVEKAYKELKKLGIIESVHGKGFFVKSSVDNKKRVLLIMNKMSSYKKIIYYSLIKNLGSDWIVDLQIHNYSADALEDILSRNLGKYNYYVIMPHFLEDSDVYLPILKLIPDNELILLDKLVPELKKTPCVYQDFEKDIFEVLEKNISKIKRYQLVTLVFPEDGNYPEEIKNGFRSFCAYNNIKPQIYGSSTDALRHFSAVCLYVIIEENDLAEILKYSKKNNIDIGKDLGIISFNDTALKEVLDITVITTDFEAMGSRCAQIIKNGEIVSERNPFYLIDRGSA